MSVTFVRDPEGAEALRTALPNQGSVAVDCEAAGFHRYSDRICLLQLSTVHQTWILDPLSVELGPYLRPVLEDPGVPVLMHGAAYDLRLLKRDLSIEVAGLRDTQVTASLLGEPSIGLQALLERHLGVRVSKKHQRADWARRPLTEEMIDYAASDTRHLHDLSQILDEKLAAAGRTAWAEEEFGWLMQSAHDPEPREEVDPLARVKGARDLDPVECTVLREGLDWRDEIAQEMDRAPFRVISDQTLVSIAKARPSTLGELANMKGVSPRLAKSHGSDLIARIARIEEEAPGNLLPYPPSPPRAPRPSPETEARLDLLKGVRNRVANETGLERGRVMANHLLMEIALANPAQVDALSAVPNIRVWQVELMGERILEALGTLAEEAAAPSRGGA
ncbi:MAG: HRDC domain-containing protein [Gemmatimonadota bacterium]|nr:HRDC domain-containing protein [Gemmatimonadota bacterium]